MPVWRVLLLLNHTLQASNVAADCYQLIPMSSYKYVQQPRIRSCFCALFLPLARALSFVTNPRPLQPSGSDEDGQMVRIMSYNVHAWRDSNHEDNFERIVEAVRLARPDILCLNEVLHPFQAPGGEEGRAYYDAVRRGDGKGRALPPSADPKHSSNAYLPLLAREVGLPNWEYGFADEDGSSFGAVPFGNAILSHHPIEVCHRVQLKEIEGDIELGNQARDCVEPRQALVSTINIGKISFEKEERRGLEGIEKETDVPPCPKLTICATHLDHKSEELREKQMGRVLDIVASIAPPGSPVVLCGDLNTFQKSDMWDQAWQELCDFYTSRGWGIPPKRSLVLDLLAERGYVDTFVPSSIDDVEKDCKRFPNPTCWTHQPLMRIDHIWTKSHNITARPGAHYRMDDILGSDHFPILCDLRIH